MSLKIAKWVDMGRYYIAESDSGLPCGVLIPLDDVSYQTRVKPLRNDSSRVKEIANNSTTEFGKVV